MRMTVSRVMPGRQDDVVGGVDSTPSRTTKTFSPEPSARKPCSFRRIASSKPALSASIFASCEFRYCPDALAAAGTVFGPIRRHDEVVTRTPVSSASSPR